ncbi:hypothetical protein KOR34_48420 [Posidoniimonas corsicana]|uniref:Uncharacterized protein n=1 Tax=Posidoniimonas corsicana TaxID=1938618 RepID=A0A5C5UVB2_9BACT|nr:hypothetical protein [Posidoniimonas corsicana]TWT30284.1 hypothetical protein KOR34_48420 [Posidoniimonas corsicana]
MDSKRRAILDRIAHLEVAITNAREYLETGEHAHWHGFRPLFDSKTRNSRTLPPHIDWVKNVFLTRQEQALKAAYDKLERLR